MLLANQNRGNTLVYQGWGLQRSGPTDPPKENGRKLKPLNIEKTIYCTTLKTAINRPMDHPGETLHTFYVR